MKGPPPRETCFCNFQRHGPIEHRGHEVMISMMDTTGTKPHKHGSRRSLLARCVALALWSGAGCIGDAGSDGASSDPGLSGGAAGVWGSRTRSARSEDFIVACWDESDHECFEYLGEEMMRDTIVAEVMRWYCRHDANVVQTTRCTRENLIGTCRDTLQFEERRDGILAGVLSPLVTFYYAPVTPDLAALRCGSDEYTPASE
jgi:hypothetical protein